MRILITGSEGFIGRNLVNFLSEKGLDLFSMGIKKLDRENHFCISSVTNYSEIKKVLENIKPDLIFHLAGSPVGDEEEQEELNFEFSRMLAEILKALSLLKTRLILMGTAAEYGFVPETILPINENQETNPYSLYGRTKLKQTDYFISGEAKPLNYIIIRPFNIYGPGMPDYLSISNFVKQIKVINLKRGSNDQYLDVGNLQVKRDFLYVKDFIKIVWELSQNENAYNGIYNVCSGKPLSLEKIVEYVINLSGENISIRQNKDRLRENDMAVHFGCNRQMLELISDIEFTPWRLGIEAMFNES